MSRDEYPEPRRSVIRDCVDVFAIPSRGQKPAGSVAELLRAEVRLAGTGELVRDEARPTGTGKPSTR